MSDSRPVPDVSLSGWRLPRRLAYVVSHALPWTSNGYAIRTHEIARALTAGGIDVVVITRPGRPWDLQGFDPATPVKTDQRIDGVRYLVLPLANDGTSPLREVLRRRERALHAAFQALRPAMVMAASNWENAQPAQFAARRMGLPFYYEQRGFWEMSQAAVDPAFAASPDFARAQEQETAVAQGARAVFTLGAAMRDELVRRGVASEAIQIVGNGIRRDLAPPPRLSRKDLGITARHVVAYVGSLSGYEGVDILLSAVARLRADGLDAAALVVGSGLPQGRIGAGATPDPAAQALRDQAARLGLAGHYHHVPQVAHDRIGAYYGLADAVVLPRRRSAMTEMVTPLKPYDAAGWGVPVFLSDMPPLDTVAAEIGGTLFAEGDSAGLAAALRARLTDPDPGGGARPLRSVYWPARIQPMLRLFTTLAEDGQAEQAALFSTVGAGVAGAGVAGAFRTGGMGGAGRFDTGAIPQAALDPQGLWRERVVVAIGPCPHLGPHLGPHLAGQRNLRLERLTRVTLLPRLATGTVGEFVIDWAGLQRDPDPEWQGLWSITDMRLNRLVMDALRIALDRGWRCRVTGPVARSEAPLFRTVANALTETLTEELPTAGVMA